jgi:hypothetical protein
MRSVLISLAVLFVAACAFGKDDQSSGNYFLKICGPEIAAMDGHDTTASDVFSAWQSGVCDGFVKGLDRANSSYNLRLTAAGQAKLTYYCKPSRVTNGQLLRVFVSYLQQHPAALQEDAEDLAFDAFSNAWPCRQPAAK